MSYSFSQFDSRSSRLAAEQRRKRLWVIAAVIAVVVGFLYVEYHISNNRTLHVVNGYSQPVEVRLESGESVSVPPQDFRTLSLSEGAHQATIVSAGREDHVTDFTVESNMWARLFNDPVFVLNVDGAAVVVWEKTVYRKDVVNDDPEQDSAIHIGKPFVAVDDVDYIFKPFPEQLKAEGTKAVKTRVAFETHSPADVLFGAPDEVTPEDRMSFAEAHLRMNGNDTDLMGKYAVYAEISNESARCLKFFQEGLDRRPVQVHWHRSYQALQTGAGREAGLVAEYRKRLESDPKDSNWLYLLGRVESDPTVADGLFQRSIDADPKNPFPWYAQSHSLRVRGRFDEAVRASAEAHRLDPNDELMEQAYYVSRLGAGQAASAESEIERQWNQTSTNVEIPTKLFEVLAIQGKTAKMNDVLASYRRRVHATADITDKDRVMSLAELELNFLQGRYREVLGLAASQPTPEERAIWSFVAHAAMGSLDEAGKSLKEVPANFQPYATLALSVAMRRGKDVKRADELQQQVVEKLKEGDADERRLASLLKSASSVTLADAEFLSTSEPFEAALLLTALGQQSPQLRSALLAQAEKRNFRPWPYQELIRGAIADARKLTN